jgi:hypothetical protein
VPSVLFYDEIRWTKLNKIVILPYFPYNPKAKLRLEVLFKKFHPRIYLTTLFFTKPYLLNTIKPFSGYKNRSLTKFKKTFTRGVPLGTWTSKFWVCRTSSWPKRLRDLKFQLSRSYGLGCRWGTNFCQRRRRRHVIDGKKLLFFTFYDFLSVKKHDLSKNNISKFLVWNQYFQYIPYMMKVKTAFPALYSVVRKTWRYASGKKLNHTYSNQLLEKSESWGSWNIFLLIYITFSLKWYRNLCLIQHSMNQIIQFVWSCTQNHLRQINWFIYGRQNSPVPHDIYP